MSVSFTGERDERDLSGYIKDESPVGKVYIPGDGVILSGPLRIRYEKRPWIEQFELDGIRPAPVRRTGIGTKGVKGFVKSLSTIYSAAYDDYREYGGDDGLDSHGYFAHAASYFIDRAAREGADKLTRMFFGYVENMWREGDREMLDITMRTVIPKIAEDSAVLEAFEENITEEFAAYLAAERSDHIQKEH